MTIKCRTLSFSLIFVIILNTVNLISHQHHCQYESVDECDSESDDDDEIVAFVDESDSETEVPVNTPGSTRTQAGRLSIPNSRYLDWLA